MTPKRRDGPENKTQPRSHLRRQRFLGYRYGLSLAQPNSNKDIVNGWAHHGNQVHVRGAICPARAQARPQVRNRDLLAVRLVSHVEHDAWTKAEIQRKFVDGGGGRVCDCHGLFNALNRGLPAHFTLFWT
jgi:hypothetical protein